MQKNLILRHMNGKEKVDLVFVVLTPFHYKAYLSHYKEAMNNKNVLILKEGYIDITSWQNDQAIIIDIPEEKFSIHDLRRDFIDKIKTYRRLIRKLKLVCSNLIEQYNLNDSLTLNIGSDRDIFTQILINKIYEKRKNKTTSLIAFEEGLGFYDKKNFLETLKTIFFPIISPVLLGEKLHFYKPMGQERHIKEVYCRFPDLIPKNGFSVYKKLLVRENNTDGVYDSKSTKALVFSFPNSAINISEEDKIEWLSFVYKKLSIKEFVIKLHPSEEEYSKNLIKPSYNWTFLEGQYAIDKLNYFDYKYIVNFSSSVIMDVLSSNYPKKKILTIGLFDKLSIASIYEQTHYINVNSLLNETEIRL